MYEVLWLKGSKSMYYLKYIVLRMEVKTALSAIGFGSNSIYISFSFSISFLSIPWEKSSLKHCEGHRLWHVD